MPEEHTLLAGGREGILASTQKVLQYTKAVSLRVESKNYECRSGAGARPHVFARFLSARQKRTFYLSSFTNTDRRHDTMFWRPSNYCTGTVKMSTTNQIDMRTYPPLASHSSRRQTAKKARSKLKQQRNTKAIVLASRYDP